MEVVDDPMPSMGPQMPAAFWDQGELRWVTLVQHPLELHVGDCRCGACHATKLADLAIRFY